MTNAEQKFQLANHTGFAAHHAVMAGHCKATADAHGSLAEHCALTDPTAARSHREISDSHKEMAACHVNEGQRHLDCAKAVGELPTSEIAGASGGESNDVKALAAQVGDLVKFLGDNANRISPNPMTPARPTLIPRFGAQAPDPDAVKKVVPELQHLVH